MILQRSTGPAPFNANLRFRNLNVRYASSVPNHYEVLGLSPSATLKEIKKKYRELSKKLHPDLNSSLSEEAKKINNESFIKVTKSYEVLSNAEEKRRYDSAHSGQISKEQELKRQEFHTRYYGGGGRGRAGQQYTSGLNSTRNRVYNANKTKTGFRSIFNGEFRDHSVNDVPHFDYEKHLRSNINLDKRYSQKQAFQHNDYMLHFLRTRDSEAVNGSSGANMYTRPNEHQRFTSTRTYNASAYGSRTFEEELKDRDQQGNKAPILLTVFTALGFFYLVSGNGDNTDSKK